MYSYLDMSSVTCRAVPLNRQAFLSTSSLSLNSAKVTRTDLKAYFTLLVGGIYRPAASHLWPCQYPSYTHHHQLSLHQQLLLQNTPHLEQGMRLLGLLQSCYLFLQDQRSLIMFSLNAIEYQIVSLTCFKVIQFFIYFINHSSKTSNLLLGIILTF